MVNSLNENFHSNEQKESQIKLSEQQKKFLEYALNILENNPEVNRNVGDIFKNNLDNILKNPEMLRKLLRKIDAAMHEEINAIVDQVESGKIYAKDGKDQAKKEIITATQVKIEATKQNIENFNA